RRAGENQVPWCEREQRRQLGDDLRHVPNHVGDVGLLAKLAVDAQPDAAALDMPDALDRVYRSNRGRVIESLADVPRAALVTRRELQVPAREVVADRVAVYQLARPGRRNVAAGAADCDHELDLVVQIVGPLRVRDGGAVRDDRVGRLREDEGRLSLRVEPHFHYMGGVVSDDTVVPADGEALLFAFDLHGRRLARIEYVRH